jgi:hypothetical protein
MAAELHVVPHVSTGGWTIATAAGPVWFATLEEARRAALSERETPVFLHDRYNRVRRLEAQA